MAGTVKVPKISLVFYLMLTMLLYVSAPTIALASQFDSTMPSDTQTEELEIPEPSSSVSARSESSATQSGTSSHGSQSVADASPRANDVASRTSTASTSDATLILMPACLAAAAGMLLCMGVLVERFKRS